VLLRPIIKICFRRFCLAAETNTSFIKLPSEKGCQNQYFYDIVLAVKNETMSQINSFILLGKSKTHCQGK